MQDRPLIRQIGSPALSDERSVPEFTEKLRVLLQNTKSNDLHRYAHLLKTHGVSANRWTSPNLIGQLEEADTHRVDLILCNGLDSDGALPLQKSVTCEFAADVVAGVALLGAITDASRRLVAVESTGDVSCAQAIEKWSTGSDVKIARLRNHYPQQNPTLLLHSVANRSLAPGLLPTHANAIVLDAVAAAAVGRCVLTDKPLSQTHIGIADLRRSKRSENVHMLSVPIGMIIADVMVQADVATGAFELRGGSPLREVRLDSSHKITVEGEVAFYLVDSQPFVNPDPCIRCGWCASGCPVHIQPAGILHASQDADRDTAERYGLMSCIECGICTYVCPSHLPLLQGIRSFDRTPADI